jgi:alpha-1,3-rhamnosyl/mannosyltransferase
VLVDPLDEQAIASALAELVADPAGARALGAAGVARAATFTWERCAAGYVAAYAEAAS